MFDTELTSVIAMFAGIAALIAYISDRAKRRLKVNTKALKLKKLPGIDETEQKGQNLEEWNFPKPPTEVIQTPAPTFTSPYASRYTQEPASGAGHTAFTGATYEEISSPKMYANERTFKKNWTHRHGLRNRSQLRESVITMTVLGPCRALAPLQDRE